MNCARYLARKEKEVYDNYRKCNYVELIIKEKKDIEILSILEKLGYPMEHLGTYFYKDLVLFVCDEIKNMNTSDLQQKNNDMLVSLNNKYSSLYIWIASDDKELGCKTFHSYIEDALLKIDYDKIDVSLASRIYGSEDITYGSAALHIAEYFLNGHTYNNGVNYKIPRVKKLQIL